MPAYTTSTAPVLLLDGGMGRQLKAMDSRSGAHSHLWRRVGGVATERGPFFGRILSEAPQAPAFVLAAHAQYVEAGADVITTNAYALVPFHIGEERFVSRAGELASLAGSLAREAASQAHNGRSVLVAASLPPPCGSYITLFHDSAAAERVLRVLVDAQSGFADLWLAETLASTAQARDASSAVHAGPPGAADKPLWLSFSLKSTGGDAPPRLLSGETVADAAAVALSLGAGALLFNCAAPELMRPAIAEAADALGANNSQIRLGAYANAFAETPLATKANASFHALRFELTPNLYTEFAGEWVHAGASIIGGCCGVGPDHIAALRDAALRAPLAEPQKYEETHSWFETQTTSHALAMEA